MTQDEAQRRRWTFYEAVLIEWCSFGIYDQWLYTESDSLPFDVGPKGSDVEGLRARI